MGNAVSARQKTWLQATEKRINFTTAVLGSIRNVKFLGLTEIMGAMIDALRVDELRISKKFRRIQTVRVCMGTLSFQNSACGLVDWDMVIKLIQSSSQSSHYCWAACNIHSLCHSSYDAGLWRSRGLASRHIALAGQSAGHSPL
jgi:hypothetical protein